MSSPFQLPTISQEPGVVPRNRGKHHWPFSPAHPANIRCVGCVTTLQSLVTPQFPLCVGRESVAKVGTLCQCPASSGAVFLSPVSNQISSVVWDSPPRVPFPLLGNLTFLPFSSYNALKEINHCLEIQKPGRAAVYSHFCFLHAQHKPTLRQGRGSEGKAPFLREQERKTYHKKKTQINISTKHPNMYLARYSRSSKSFTQMNGLLKWVPWHFTSERLQDSA